MSFDTRSAANAKAQGPSFLEMRIMRGSVASWWDVWQALLG